MSHMMLAISGLCMSVSHMIGAPIGLDVMAKRNSKAVIHHATAQALVQKAYTVLYTQL